MKQLREELETYKGESEVRDDKFQEVAKQNQELEEEVSNLRSNQELLEENLQAMNE